MSRLMNNERFAAYLLVGPFVAIYLWLFFYPSAQMLLLSLTQAPLIGEGTWVGLENFGRLLTDRVFSTAVLNTAYFILLTVVPGTAVSLLIALCVNRLRGVIQGAVLAAFFLPYILPVSVVYLIWWWIFDQHFGIAQFIIEPLYGQRVAVWRNAHWFIPSCAFVTIWWTCGFSVLLFLAALRNISSEIYEAAELEGAGRLRIFRTITWPLIWPITALCLSLQLILQLQIFDLFYLFSKGGRTNQTMVLVQYVYEQAFVYNRGGYAAAIAVILFLFIVILSTSQMKMFARGK